MIFEELSLTKKYFGCSFIYTLHGYIGYIYIYTYIYIYIYIYIYTHTHTHINLPTRKYDTRVLKPPSIPNNLKVKGIEP